MTSDLRSIASDTSLSGVPSRSAEGRRPSVAFDTHLARLASSTTAKNTSSDASSSAQTVRSEAARKDSSDRQSRVDRTKKTSQANSKDAAPRRSEGVSQSRDNDKAASGQQNDSSTASALNSADNATASSSSAAAVEDTSPVQKDKSGKDAGKESASDNRPDADASAAQAWAAQSQLPSPSDGSGTLTGLAGDEQALDQSSVAGADASSEASSGLRAASLDPGKNDVGSIPVPTENTAKSGLPGPANTQVDALPGNQAARDGEASAAQQTRASHTARAVQADVNSDTEAQAESSSQQSSFDDQPSDEKSGHSAASGSNEATLVAQLQSADPTGGTAALAHTGAGVNGSAAGGTFTSPTASAAQPQPSPEAAFSQANHPSIVKAIHGQLLPQGGSMHLRLDPPELGALQVSVHMRDGMMTASFQTSNDQASQLLSHSLSQLKHALEAQGVNVQKIHVEQASTSHDHDASSNGQSHQNHGQSGSEQSRQQRRELLQQMWRRLAIGNDPLDMVA